MIIYYGATDFVKNPRIARWGKPLSVLQPFEAINKKGIERDKFPWWDKFMLDSGAFAVSQRGITMDLQEYIDWLLVNHHLVDQYVCLDVVGDGETSRKNWRRMVKAGLNPIPVFHDGEPLEILKEYAAHTDYIGLGAVAFMDTRQRMVFFDRVFSMFPDPNEIGFHGFGVLDDKLLLRYPWRSVDATSIATNARYGTFFMEGAGWIHVSVRMSPVATKWKTPLKESVVRDYVAKLGYDYDVAIQGDQEAPAERMLISLHHYEEIRKKVPTIFKPSHRVRSLVNY